MVKYPFTYDSFGIIVSMKPSLLVGPWMPWTPTLSAEGPEICLERAAVLSLLGGVIRYEHGRRPSRSNFKGSGTIFERAGEYVAFSDPVF